MNQEYIYEVNWQGPYKASEIAEKVDKHDLENYVLYKVYGSHPMYGNNVLLYIGMTEQRTDKRLNQHDYWMDEERYDQSTVYLASIGLFESWEKSEEIEIFKKPSREIIEKIEALLIYAHQPSHNSKNKQTAKSATNLRIFNTGAHGSLMPEVSGLYYDC